jgi:signal transduction histidine kinase
MKTPLTVVRGQLQLLERQLEQLLTNGLLAGTPELVEVEKRIQALREGLLRGVQHSGRLDRLINDIVDLANIQEGHWALKLEHFDLAALLRETVQDAQQLWPTRRLLLNLPDTEEAPVHADEMRIRQVIANYVTNAHKYSPAEHPLEITLHREPQQVGVLVRDHGPGLPFEEQARVWQRFYRVPGIKAQPGEEEG